MSGSAEKAALRGLTVLELAESVRGEYCGKLLADLGATLIKVERPGEGSPTRRLAPFRGEERGPDGSGLFAYLNTNKQSVVLDLEAADGVAMLSRLLAKVDAVVDDHAPGWLARVGLAPATIGEHYPALLLCSITPYGQAPGENRLHAEDLNVFHASGWGYHTPSAADPALPPLKGAGRFLPSYEAGLEAALCVAAAAYERMASGRGQFIDVSVQAVLASRADYVLAQQVAGDMPVGDDRRALDLQGPAGIFRCREGYAYLWMSAPAHWSALRQLLGDPGWMDDFPADWLERACTPERVARCREHLAGWLRTRDKHETSAAAQALGLTMVPVCNVRDLAASEQFIHRRFFVEMEQTGSGTTLHPTVPYRLSETPARLHAPAPRLGEHGDIHGAAPPAREPGATSGDRP